MLHYLKIQEAYYLDIKKGIKTFEIRKFDRDYKVGDFIQFLVLNKGTTYFSTCFYKIVYILSNVPNFGLKDGYCILSIKKSVYKDK